MNSHKKNCENPMNFHKKKPSTPNESSHGKTLYTQQFFTENTYVYLVTFIEKTLYPQYIFQQYRSKWLLVETVIQ